MSSEKSQFDVRFAQVGDYEEINELFNSTFNIQRTLERFYWKFCSSCWVDTLPVAVVCSIEGKIVGSYGMLPHRFSVFENTVDAIQVVDVCVDPAYRQRGANRACYEFFLQEAGQWARFAFGFPGELASTVGFERLGYRSVCLSVFLKLTIEGPRSSCSFFPTGSHIIHRSNSISKDHDAFLAEYERTCRICTKRTSDYLNWRYSPSSGRSFTIFSAKRDSSIEGLAITRTFDESSHVAVWIYELLILSSETIVELLDSIVGSIDSDKTVEIHFWCNDQFLWRTELVNTGFQRIELGPRRVAGMPLGPFDPLIERCFDSSNWNLTLGDTDL